MVTLTHQAKIGDPVSHSSCISFRSGTEEEYGELNTLLEDITTYLEDMSTNVVTKQKKKEEEDRSKGLAMRKAAMETYASTST